MWTIYSARLRYGHQSNPYPHTPPHSWVAFFVDKGSLCPALCVFINDKWQSMETIADGSWWQTISEDRTLESVPSLCVCKQEYSMIQISGHIPSLPSYVTVCWWHTYQGLGYIPKLLFLSHFVSNGLTAPSLNSATGSIQWIHYFFHVSVMCISIWPLFRSSQRLVFPVVSTLTGPTSKKPYSNILLQ